MLNSSHVRRKLESGALLRRLPRGEGAADALYLTILSRRATPAEVEAIRAHARAAGLGARDVALDVAWALVNSAEFLYRH